MNGWERFWFKPEPTSTMALVRIAFGVVMCAWTAALGPDVLTFYGRGNFAASETRGWSILEFFPSDEAVLSCYAAPILDPQGEVIGALDLSGRANVAHTHALGMVRLAVAS